MDPNLFTKVLESSALAALAFFAIFMVNKLWELRKADCEVYAKDIAAMRDQTMKYMDVVIAALNSNTKAFIELRDSIEKNGFGTKKA